MVGSHQPVSSAGILLVVIDQVLEISGAFIPPHTLSDSQVESAVAEPGLLVAPADLMVVLT